MQSAMGHPWGHHFSNFQTSMDAPQQNTEYWRIVNDATSTPVATNRDVILEKLE